LCGDAYRHFRILRDELNIMAFDTGFPIDLAKATRELGPEVRLQGGVHVTILRDASPEGVREECRRILLSGVKENKKFIFRDANNLAPHTPLENILAMYDAVKEFGKYE
jgi:uroporphyrinogen decarboxylase